MTTTIDPTLTLDELLTQSQKAYEDYAEAQAARQHAIQMDQERALADAWAKFDAALRAALPEPLLKWTSLTDPLAENEQPEWPGGTGSDQAVYITLPGVAAPVKLMLRQNWDGKDYAWRQGPIYWNGANHPYQVPRPYHADWEDDPQVKVRPDYSNLAYFGDSLREAIGIAIATQAEWEEAQREAEQRTTRNLEKQLKRKQMIEDLETSRWGFVILREIHPESLRLQMLKHLNEGWSQAGPMTIDHGIFTQPLLRDNWNADKK